MYDDYLFHYGRKGMKWGQNIFGKARTVSGSLTSKPKTKLQKRKEERAKQKRAKVTQRQQRQAELKRNLKPVRSMSEAELKKRVARLKLEKEYKTLRREQMSTGQKLVQDILKDSTKNIATQAVTYAMGAAVNKGARMVSKNITGDIVNPKKGQKDK